MTQDEIIRMAREAGFYQAGHTSYQVITATIQDFAKLVAERERERLTDAAMKAAEKAVDLAIALEREACAEIAESKRHAPHFVLTSMPSQNGTAVDIANLIRARGQA